MFEKLPSPKTIIEPFRIKAVEPIPMLDARQRSAAIKEAGYNLFKLRADQVMFDLLTDSGTGAMSARQWAGMMEGDESYAGSKSFYRFEKAVQDLTGHEHVIPTHQGRAAETLLMRTISGSGKTVIANTHFDTTRANVEAVGAEALDMPDPSNENSFEFFPFKGNIDLKKLKERLLLNPKNVSAVVITVTNNSVGGQPVSLDNVKKASELARERGVPLFIDCARFAENCYFIQQRDPAFKNVSVKKIAQTLFSYADGAWMSMKKDAFGNIGGFLTVRNADLAHQLRTNMILSEGFPTYGGLAGRDLEALAIGLEEVVDEHYLAYRIRSVEYFAEGLNSAGMKVVMPAGGHAVYIDAQATLPHIPALKLPGQSLSVALYEATGIRSVEVGTAMLGRRDPKTGTETPALKELVRLAVPRRTYTQSHVDYMIEGIAAIKPFLSQLRGYHFEYQAPFLRHFTARFGRE